MGRVMDRANTADAIQAEANRVGSLLASSPEAHSTVTRPVLRRMLLDTPGWLFCCGSPRDIKSTPLGAGVYKVWTVAQPPRSKEGA